MQLLNSRVGSLHIIQLQGYLFFGTVEQVVKRVRNRVKDKEQQPLRYLVIDFKNVSGVDSAATSGFLKICNLAWAAEINVVFSSLSVETERSLVLAGVNFGPQFRNMSVVDLDHALEWCEEALLAGQEQLSGRAEILHHLSAILGPRPRLGDMVNAMERRVMVPGDVLIRAGDTAEDLFILGHGRIVVQITRPTGQVLRLRSMTSGAIAGEIALYLGGKRTADVIIEEASVIYRLTFAKLKRLENEDGELASLFHRLLSISLAAKLVEANRLIETVQN